MNATAVQKKEKDPQAVFDTTDTQIERIGHKIVLPGEPIPMTYEKAREVLLRIEKDENQEFQVVEQLDAFVLDGAVAFWKAVVKKYGFASPIPTPGFFGPQPPQMITVKTGPGPKDSIQVPWGRMVIPNIDKPVDTDIGQTPTGLMCFQVAGLLRRTQSTVLKELMELAREILATESIYRGKAFELHVESDGSLPSPLDSPEFLRTDHVSAEELILNREVEQLVKVNLLTPITHTAQCIKHAIPIKRGVLLEGPYGTGKSMTGYQVARTCEENGWTFILLPHIAGLEHTLRLARRYAPAVVFAEDIDRILDERDDAANDLINTIDGVISKDMQVITVLTTNHADRIDQVMIRPGRIDAVITYSPPNPEAVGRLIMLYARDRLAKGQTLEKIGALLAGQIPAVIREVVERAKLAMISRDETTIVEEDLITAALGMGKHLTLLTEQRTDRREDALGRLAEAFFDVITEASGEGIIKRMEPANEKDHDKTQRRVDMAAHAVDGAAKKRHDETGKKLTEIDTTVTRIAQRLGG